MQAKTLLLLTLLGFFFAAPKLAQTVKPVMGPAPALLMKAVDAPSALHYAALFRRAVIR